MSDSLIRLARVGDEAAIHAAHMKSIREVCVKDHGEEEIRGWGYRELGNRWTAAINAENVWVVEIDGRIEGLASVAVVEKDAVECGYIHALYLTPVALGHGFGGKLAELMIQKIRSLGLPRIYLDSTITAHGFYEKLGFVDNGGERKVEIGGHPVTCFPMVMELGAVQT